MAAHEGPTAQEVPEVKETVSLKPLRRVRVALLVAGLLLFLFIPLFIFSLYFAEQESVPIRPPAHENAPNIILIVTDDQRADTLQYMPNVTKLLSARGITFTNAYSTTPLCCPARASLLTGLYTHNHEIWTNKNGYRLFGDSDTLPVWLQAAGYRTGLVGKYLNGYQTTTVPPGWDTWYGRTKNTYYGYNLNENGKIVSYGFTPKDYSTDVYADLAVTFINGTAGEVEVQETVSEKPKPNEKQKKQLKKQERKELRRQQRKNQSQSQLGFGLPLPAYAQETAASERQRPYFLMVAVDAPHSDGGRTDGPRNRQQKNQASDEDAPAIRLKNQRDQLVLEDDDDEVTTDGQDSLKTHVVKDFYAMPAEIDRQNCQDINIAASSAFAERDVSDKPAWVKAIPAWNRQDIQRMERFASSQVCSLLAVDRMVKKIIDAVDDDLDNTVIIFTSDNGYSWGEHRWSAKNCVYEVCSRVPLVISDPRVVTRPETATGFVELIDVPVTIASLAYATPPSNVNGKNLVPVLRDPKLMVREDVLLEVTNNKNQPKGRDFAIRTKTHKYVELSSGERELYDLIQDPNELTNLISGKAVPVRYREVVADLASRLKRKKAE